MGIVSFLLSFTVDRLLRISGFSENKNVLSARKMDEKALEVYGKRMPSSIIIGL